MCALKEDLMGRVNKSIALNYAGSMNILDVEFAILGLHASDKSAYGELGAMHASPVLNFLPL